MVQFATEKKINIGNIYSGYSPIQAHVQLLVILMDIIDWCSIQTLLAGFPNSIDHTTILNQLYRLYVSGVIITRQDEPSQSATIATNTITSKLQFNANNHTNMLKDTIRVNAYKQAIEQVVTPDSVVMDLGCGTGILGFLAAQAGAIQVYMVERDPAILKIAKDIARLNNIHNVTFVEGQSNQLPPESFPEKPTLLVSEILGDQVLDERVLEYTLDVRDRLLAPGATLIPGVIHHH